MAEYHGRITLEMWKIKLSFYLFALRNKIVGARALAGTAALLLSLKGTMYLIVFMHCYSFVACGIYSVKMTNMKVLMCHSQNHKIFRTNERCLNCDNVNKDHVGFFFFTLQGKQEST